MTLETEIQQTNFKNEHQKLVLNIIFTANWYQARHRELLKPYDLTTSQYNILRILRGQKCKAISVLDIKTRMLDKMSDVSRLVEKLRCRNLVSRMDSATDRRLVDVSITDEGLNLLEELDKMEEEMDLPLKNLSGEEAEIMNKFLDKLRNE